MVDSLARLVPRDNTAVRHIAALILRSNIRGPAHTLLELPEQLLVPIAILASAFGVLITFVKRLVPTTFLLELEDES